VAFIVVAATVAAKVNLPQHAQPSAGNATTADSKCLAETEWCLMRHFPR